MKNENRNEEAVSPVIATILMVAITVVLAGVLYVWASSLAEGNTDGDLSLYAFTGADAEGAANAPSSATNDTLIKLTMTQGSDLNWAYMSVKLTTNAGDIYFCSSPNAAEGAACQLVDNGRDTTDATMSVGDVVTIMETDTDICSTSCTMDVEITNTRTDEVIDRTAGVAAE